MDPYKVLIEVMKTESFTRAAENLYTSQPSLKDKHDDFLNLIKM